MATEFSGLKIDGSKATHVKVFGDSFLDDVTWEEIHAHACDLKLSCLKQVSFFGDCIFNRRQSHDILTIEIPALRKQNLSIAAQHFLDQLEAGIKDLYSPNDENIYLYFEGD